MAASVGPVWRSPPTRELTRLSAVAFAAQAFHPRFCEKCNHVGFLFEEDLSEFSEGGWYRRYPCECNTDSLRDHAAMREAGVPDVFLGATLASWNNVGRTPSEKQANERALKVARDVAARLEEASREGLNLWLHGTKGSGKTWVACSLLREAILTRGFTGRFFQSSELVRVSIHEAERFSMLYDVGWLVLDGIDQVPRTASGYEASTLHALVSHRVQNRAPTVFTAQRPLYRIHEMFGDPHGRDLGNLLPTVTVELALVGGDFSESKGIREKWNPR